MRRYVLIGTVLVAAIIACAGVAGLAAPNPDRHGRLYAAEKDNSPAVAEQRAIIKDKRTDREQTVFAVGSDITEFMWPAKAVNCTCRSKADWEYSYSPNQV